jgi:hypothetical protein
MASRFYTPPTANQDGETADAKDVNSVNDATLTGFELVQAEIDALDTVTLAAYSTLAQAWAEHPEDSVVPTQPPGSYSSFHWAQKSLAYSQSASASASSASTSEANALSHMNNASTYATNASNSAGDAQTAQAAASASALAAAGSASSANGSAISASNSAANASNSAGQAASSAANAAASQSACLNYYTGCQNYFNQVSDIVSTIPETTLAEGDGIDLSVAAGVTTISVNNDEIIRPFSAVLSKYDADCVTGDLIKIIVTEDMNGWTLTNLEGTVSTAGTTGTMTIQALKNGATLMGQCEIASGSSDSGAFEYGTEANRTVATGDTITITITAVHTTEAKGCSVSGTFNGTLRGSSV